jgi:hypothetical protein
MYLACLFAFYDPLQRSASDAERASALDRAKAESHAVVKQYVESGSNSFPASVNSTTYITVISEASTKDFTAALTGSLLNLTARALHIYYCGHGTPDGELVFSDGVISAKKLAETLLANPPHHFPETMLAFNCCFGLAAAQAFASQLPREAGSNGDVWHVLKEYAKMCGLSIDDVQNIECLANLHTISDIPADDPFSTLEWRDSDREMWRKLANKRYIRCGYRIPWGGTSIFLWPFSVGLMPAEGALQLLVGEGVEATEDLQQYLATTLGIDAWRRTRGKSKPAKQTGQPSATKASRKNHKYAASTNSPVPRIEVFQVGKGDSALLSWGTFTMLVDGGLKTYCALESGKLPDSLTVVALTHGDSDHIGGLDPLPGAVTIDLLMMFGLTKSEASAIEAKQSPRPKTPQRPMKAKEEGDKKQQEDDKKGQNKKGAQSEHPQGIFPPRNSISAFPL